MELGKDVLIVLLACSAVWLLARTQLMGPVGRIWREEVPQAGPDQSESGSQMEAARPLSASAVLVQDGGVIRSGVRYDEAACDALFQQTAGLLVEALSSAGEREAVGRREWERALTASTGVCFDFQGKIPLEVLSRWLSGESSPLSGTVRRLLLADWRDAAALYFRDEEDGNYYRCPSQVVDLPRLEEALSGLTDSGAFYAFESESYSGLDPDTLFSRELPALAVYTVSNPVSGGQAALEELAGGLGFAINTNGVYYAGEWVARSGDDTLRLSSRGVLSYLAGEGGGDHFRLSGDGLFDKVETCRRLAAAVLGSRCGQARLYLLDARETERGCEVRFGYSLNGIPVWLEEGCAADFLVEDGRVARFSMRLRSYAESGETTVMLPVRQAAAALAAGGQSGEELLLMYADSGGETASAGWMAAGSEKEG